MSSNQSPPNAGHPNQPGSNSALLPSPPGAIPTPIVYSTSDPEDPTRNEANDYEEKFVRKIHSLIESQLVFTFGIFSVTSLFGYNLNAHIFFTVAASIFIGVTSRRFQKHELFLTLRITLVLCYSLTLFASLTKSVFVESNIMYVVVFCVILFCLIGLYIFGIITMFFVSHKKIIIYGSLGVILFSFCFIHDMQIVMMNGNSTSPKKSGFAKLSLYNSFMSIFLYILMIIGGVFHKIS